MFIASKVNGKDIQFFIEGRVLHVEIKQPLRRKCPYSELFWSAFSRIWTEYSVSLRIQLESGKILTRITPNMNTFHAMNFI